MSIGGPQALASLEEAMRDIRREEDDISRRMARSSERLSKTKESEAELFRQLAQLRLDPAIQAQLDGTISSAEAKARQTLKSHAKAVEAAEKTIATLESERAELIEARHAAQGHLHEKQRELTALAESLAATLAADAAFQRQRQAAEDLAEIAEQSLRKTEQAETDREEKGQPYRDDPLFFYLWQAGYGTASYRANNLVRYLDGLVANLVGFAKARPNYAMLTEIPRRLREHAERQQANAQAAEAALHAMEIAAMDQAGGKPLREDVARLEDKIEAVDAQILACEDRRDEAANALQELAEGRDPAFAAAAAELAAALEREDIKTLLAEARQTRTGQDDTLVAQIDDIRARIREEEEENREQRERLRTLAARRRELEDIQWEFKKQRFDDPRSSFREEKLVGDLLNDFLRGGISAATYWDHWRRSQDWAPGQEWGRDWENKGRAGRTRRPKSPPSSSSGADAGSGFRWPDNSFGASSERKGKSGGGFGGPWSGGGFSRPRNSGSSGRSGSAGSRKNSSFKTGGGF